MGEGSSSRFSSSQGNGYQVPPPITGTRPQHVSEAEAFLQDMFRPSKMLKVEPVDDVPLPPVAPRSLHIVRFSPHLVKF